MRHELFSENPSFLTVLLIGKKHHCDHDCTYHPHCNIGMIAYEAYNDLHELRHLRHVFLPSEKLLRVPRGQLVIFGCRLTTGSCSAEAERSQKPKDSSPPSCSAGLRLKPKCSRHGLPSGFESKDSARAFNPSSHSMIFLPLLLNRTKKARTFSGLSVPIQEHKILTE